MSFEDLLHELDAFRCRHVRKPHETAVLNFVHEQQLPEIGVDSHKDPLIFLGPFEQRLVSRVLAKRARLHYIVSIGPEPFRQTNTGATIYQESQRLTTSTASIDSFATTARAYSNEA